MSPSPKYGFPAHSAACRNSDCPGCAETSVNLVRSALGLPPRVEREWVHIEDYPNNKREILFYDSLKQTLSITPFWSFTDPERMR